MGRKETREKVDEQIMQLMYLDEIANAPSENALISDFWLPDIQIGGGRIKPVHPKVSFCRQRRT